MEIDWAALLNACHRGEGVAREKLFSALRVRLLTIAQYRLRGISTAILEDLVQSTLVVMIERIAAIESNPQLYALQILRNKIGDYLRAAGRKLEMTLSPTDGEGDGEDGTSQMSLADPDAGSFETKIETSELVQRIRRAIHRLSPICQALFLAMLEGRNINEVWELAVATDSRLTRSTFDKRLFDCRKRLRAIVGENI